MKKKRKIISILMCVTILVTLLVPNYKAGQAAKKITLNYTKKTLNVGSNFKLKVNGSKQKVKWSSNNKKIATVNSTGVVTAKRKGTTSIVAKVAGKKLNCKITVKVAYGSISGNITYFYNNYRGYVADTGAKVFVIDDNSKVVGKATVNGQGNYTIQHIPVGDYFVVISSKESKSEDVLYGTFYDEFYNEYGEFLNVAGRVDEEYDIPVYKNETTTLDYEFTYSDF